jgi:hypothetical protein
VPKGLKGLQRHLFAECQWKSSDPFVSVSFCHHTDSLCLSSSDWAVQNQKLEAVSFFLESYEIDVLEKNAFGRSVLTDAFQTSNTDIIGLCLSHSSSSEERLLSVDAPTGGSVVMEGDQEEKGADQGEGVAQVVHEFDFTHLASAFESLSHSGDGQDDSAPASPRPRKTLRIRELPITRADNPFGSEASPEDDTTGLGIWPSAVLMARYAVEMKELLKGQVVLELGCGCGIPGLAVGGFLVPPPPSHIPQQDIATPSECM